MVVLSDHAWLQGAFNALVAIFDRVGLLTNARKAVSMVCHPCQAGSENHAEEAYGRRVMGMGGHMQGGNMRRWNAGSVGRYSQSDPC